MSDEKVVVVTGGGTGIGAAIAHRFARGGWRVVICGRREQTLAETVARAAADGHEIVALRADVTDEAEVDRLIDGVRDRFGRIDAWINNAGTVALAPLASVSLDRWEASIRSNLTSVFICSNRAAEVLGDGGSIVNLSSFTGLIPSVNNGPYSVAKAGVLALTRVLASELAPKGIRVNAIVPGYISTEMGNLDIDTKAERILEPISLRRFGTPEDIASGVYFLCGPEAGYISGTSLQIAGGKFATQNAAEAWPERRTVDA